MATQPAAPREPRRAPSNAVAMVALAVALLSGGRQEATRQLQPIQDLPPDVAAIVEDTWEGFATTFPVRLDCLETVRLELVDDVPGGDAEYQPADRLIRIEIPTSPRRFRESLVHELAHHLDSMCVGVDDLRHVFMLTQGLPAQAGWSAGETWQAIPSEHFAEAVVEAVTGERVLHDDLLTISTETLELVRRWGAGNRS